MKLYELTVTLQFFEDRVFSEDPRVLLVRYLFKRLKKITCLTKEASCRTCRQRLSCIYYKLSGHHFKFSSYIPIILPTQLTPKKSFKTQDQLVVKLILVGTYTYQLREFISLILSECSERGFLGGKPIYLHPISVHEVTLNQLKTSQFKVLGELSDDLIKTEHRRLKKLNELFQADYNIQTVHKSELNVIPYSQRGVKINEVKIDRRGQAGILNVSEADQNLLNILTVIGVGRRRFIGFGLCEPNDNKIRTR